LRISYPLVATAFSGALQPAGFPVLEVAQPLPDSADRLGIYSMLRGQVRFHNGAMARERTRTESRAIYYAAATFALAAPVALAAFWGQVVPLFGEKSIGNVASVLAALAAFVGFLMSWKSPQPDGDKTSYGAAHRILTSGALAFCHAAVALLLTVALFYLFQNAFEGVRLDPWTSAGLAGGVAAVCGYAAYLAGARVTSLRLSTTLALFLVSGIMVSMITSPNPYWWQIHFSSLGTGDSASATAFNLTLIVGGLVLVGLADVVAAEFARWQATRAERGRARVNLTRVAIATLGVLLAGVGLFTFDDHLLLHNISTGLLVVVFAALSLSLHRLAPGFDKAFYMFSYTACAGVAVCAWLVAGVGYMNITAAEMVIAGIIFAWLVVFVRQIAAGLADSGDAAQANHTRLESK
jgi:hypothetical membrane protein